MNIWSTTFYEAIPLLLTPTLSADFKRELLVRDPFLKG